MEQVGRITPLVMRSIHKSSGIYPLPYTDTPHFLLPFHSITSLLYETYISTIMFHIYYSILGEFLTNGKLKWFFSDVNTWMSLQVLFVKQCHLSICQIANIYLKSLVSAHVSRQLTSPRECLYRARHIAHYISQKYINNIHIRNKCIHVLVCNVVILEKMCTVNIKEATYYVSLFQLSYSSHTTLFHLPINDLCHKL
jgi:hypothetical protein